MKLSDATKIYLGSVEATKIYLGAVEVWGGFDPQDDPDMVLVVDTTLPGATTTVALSFALSVDCTVDWGDESSDSYTTTGSKTHTYAEGGEYTIRISGTVARFGSTTAKPSYKRLIAPGAQVIADWLNGLRNAANLVSVPTRMIKEDVTNISGVFRNSPLVNPDTTLWEVGNCTTFSDVFNAASAANPDLSRWVLNVGLTTMSNMLLNSNISITNYSRALIRFANQVYLNHGPYNVPFGAGPKYHATTHSDITGQYDNAPAARAFLAGAFAVTISGATDADADGEYTLDEGTLTNDNSWTLTFATDTWTLKDDSDDTQASGTGNDRSPATVTTWTGTESGITVTQTGAGWTVTDGGAE
jgi:hypothetical protein